jgi:hypothetical protein
VPNLPIDRDRDDRDDAGCRHLLAVHGVRRRVERVAVALGSASSASMAVTPGRAIRQLNELIAALDRRMPQVERAGEAKIARDAAALKARALKRIEELERAKGS